MRSFFAVIVSACTALFITVPAAAQELVPLNLYYSPTREDNHTTAIPSRQEQALREGYRFVRTEACLFREQEPGTVPFRTLYSPAREEHISVSTDAGFGDAARAGYGLLSPEEGFVFPTARPGLVPIILYYNTTREDNFSTASDTGRQSAREAAYRQVRIEGYALPAEACSAFVAPITDSEYVIIFDQITCSGECSLGGTTFGVSSKPEEADLRTSEAFALNEPGTYNLNFGFRFTDTDGGLRFFITPDLDALPRPLSIEREGMVTLNGPQIRRFNTRFLDRRNLSFFEVTFRVFRASP